MTELDPADALGFCECGCGERAPISDRTDATRGMVKGQPHRFVLGHSRRGRRRPRYEIRDCGYETPCWVWLLAVNRETGYGYEHVGACRKLGHRVLYEAQHGPIPAGLQLDHLCRNRACVNPAHLEPVTNAENARRGAKAKLGASDIAAIRASGLTHARLAETYGVHASHISRIKGGKVWIAT